MIFPEGTRRAPGAEPSYKYGIVHLYAETGAACLPIALNSGLFWPRRSFRRYPGTIVVEVLDPIAPGLDRQAFAARLQQAIETATARLVAEGEREACAEATSWLRALPIVDELGSRLPAAPGLVSRRFLHIARRRGSAGLVRALQPLRQQMQLGLAQPERFHGGDGRDH